MSEEKKVKMGNPVLPNTPVPSQVRMSTLPEPPEPVARLGTSGEEQVPRFPTEVRVVDVDGDGDAKPKGTITISVFENSPYEIEFTGIVTGSELDMAWRFMMKEYRVWKHMMFKRLEEDKKDGGV